MEDLFVHHIFFHSLIAYPELAWNKNNPQAQGFEDWMLSVDEFKHLLEQLYNNNYVLVRQRDLFTFDDHGQPHYIAPQLPPGKRPLVLSLDDVNYYKYMRDCGFAKRLIILADGQPANELITPAGNSIISKEADCIPILEDFICAHPDFSWHGARGIIAVTGFEGALGYRVAPDNERESSLEAEEQALIAVANRLKNLGWEFACHSYTHNSGWFKVAKPDINKIVYDTDKWKRIMEPLLGATDIYISPFGTLWDTDSHAHRYIIDAGFKFYCNVAATRLATLHKDHIIIPRVNIDGFNMRNNRFELELYYGSLDTVIDKRRLKYYPPAGNKRTFKRFLQFLHFAANMPTVYIWGGLGLPFTKQVLTDLKRIYPDYYTDTKISEYKPYLDYGFYGFDCSGLIKCFLFGGTTNFVCNDDWDYNSTMLCQKAWVKGSIQLMPDIPGICLHLPGHVGVYIGDGKVIEATNNPAFGNGVVVTRLQDRDWQRWFLCRHINYLSYCKPLLKKFLRRYDLKNNERL